MTQTKKNKKHKIGGKVIACGGYGCVFNPALKCKDSLNREKNKITKLMINKYAIKEFEEIKLIREKLTKIKNYKNYYLIDDITLCKPDKLTKNDLQLFSKKCKALPKNNITKKNINKKLDDIMALNIPNGGLPIDDFLYLKENNNKLVEIHNVLVTLLKNGIIPMNNSNIFHSDIKDSNILIKKNKQNKLQARLIDWGLTVQYTPKQNDKFPLKWRNRPLQFNTPFSIIIFTDLFYENYTTYLKNGGKNEEGELKPFVINYINEWTKTRGAGHYKFINEIMFLLYKNSLTTIHKNDLTKIIETEITLPYIVNYIVNILVYHTKFKTDGSLNLREYLDNVFVKNIDIWGFISAYYPLLELLGNNYAKLNQTQLDIFKHLQFIYTNYLFKKSESAINITNLYEDLDKLGKLLLQDSNNILYNNYNEFNVNISKTKSNKTNKKNAVSLVTKKKQLTNFKKTFLQSFK